MNSDISAYQTEDGHRALRIARWPEYTISLLCNEPGEPTLYRPSVNDADAELRESLERDCGQFHVYFDKGNDPEFSYVSVVGGHKHYGPTYSAVLIAARLAVSEEAI